MKLLILLGVEATEPQLRALFQAGGVEIYSEFAIKGHRAPATVPDPANWFATAGDGVYSVMAFAFVTPEKATSVMQALQMHNKQQPTAYPLHAFLLGVEAAV